MRLGKPFLLASCLLALFAHVNLPTIAFAANPISSTFFASATIELSSTLRTLSDGDLWASCWADDDHLYAANGDGKGFNLFAPSYSDIVINRISGAFPMLSGVVTAAGDAIGSIWNRNGRYNRKPTGMLCIDNAIYVAVQDLNLNFDDAPSASISKSTDYGATWTWDESAPMFDDYQFTTMMFLDYGRNSEHAPDEYVYVYGTDHNWRDSFTRAVPDPVDLYLARVHRTAILNRAEWQFFAGFDLYGDPAWSSDIGQRVSVLHHDQAEVASWGGTRGLSNTALGQGGVVYNKPLNRYIYTTWTQFTFQFYEAPKPWGPWNRFLHVDFGHYPWDATSYGGYGTTIPSKFISEDGLTMWVQSNVCPCGNAGVIDYGFSLRKLVVELANAIPSAEVSSAEIR
jgi:hypothetical protein